MQDSLGKKDIDTELGRDKSAILVMRREQVVNGDDIQLSGDKTLTSLKECMYLGVLESDSQI